MNHKAKTKSKFFSYIQITRPINCLFGSLTVVIGLFNAFSGVGFFHVPNNILVLLGGLFVYIMVAAASNIINDIFDIEIDRINRPNRPIPSGKIQKKTAIIYSGVIMGIGFVISIFLAFFTPNIVLVPLLTVFFGGIGFIYSWKGKRNGFLGNIMVGIAFSSGIPFGALLIVPFLEIPPYLWFFFTTSFCLLISRELVKGMEDIQGDSKYNLKTIANLRGFKFTAWISGIFSVGAILTFTIPIILYSFNLVSVILMVIGNVFVLSSIIFLIKPDLKENQTKASFCLKIGAYLGLLAYLMAIF